MAKARNIIELEIVEKFNPYHDSLGRFTSPGMATSFTIRTKSSLAQGAADKAVEREKKRNKSGFTSAITGTTYNMPELENDEAYQYREKAINTVETWFSSKPTVKENYDKNMERYIAETDTDEWKKRAGKNPYEGSKRFLMAKTPNERKQEVDRRKDIESHDKAILRAKDKQTPKFAEYSNYRDQLYRKYYDPKDPFYGNGWERKMTSEEYKKLNELREATVFRNKKGQWQIAKSMVDIEISN